MNKDITLKIIMVAVVILGCILIRFGLTGSGALLTLGFIFVIGGIMAQVALVIIPVLTALREKLREKKAEDEDDNAGLGIK